MSHTKQTPEPSNPDTKPPRIRTILAQGLLVSLFASVLVGLLFSSVLFGELLVTATVTAWTMWRLAHRNPDAVPFAPGRLPWLAMVVPVVSSVLLQILYFAGLGEELSGDVLLVWIVGNLLITTLFALVGAIPVAIGLGRKAKRSRAKQHDTRQRQSEQQRLNRLMATVLLIGFVSTTILPPFVPVRAGPDCSKKGLTAQELVECWEPGTEITVETKPSDLNPKRRVPVDADPSVNSTQLELPAYEQGSGSGTGGENGAQSERGFGSGIERGTGGGSGQHSAPGANPGSPESTVPSGPELVAYLPPDGSQTPVGEPDLLATLAHEWNQFTADPTGYLADATVQTVTDGLETLNSSLQTGADTLSNGMQTIEAGMTMIGHHARWALDAKHDYETGQVEGALDRGGSIWNEIGAGITAFAADPHGSTQQFMQDLGATAAFLNDQISLTLAAGKAARHASGNDLLANDPTGLQTFGQGIFYRIEHEYPGGTSQLQQDLSNPSTYLNIVGSMMSEETRQAFEEGEYFRALGRLKGELTVEAIVLIADFITPAPPRSAVKAMTYASKISDAADKTKTAKKLQQSVTMASLPRNVKTSVQQGSLINPKYAKNQRYTAEDLRKLEEANPRAHVFSKHVGKSDTYLKDRARAENKDFTSSFYTKDDYAYTMNFLLNDERTQEKIQRFVRRPSKNNTIIQVEIDKDVGKVYNKNDDTIHSSRTITLFLKKTNNQDGYYVYTSYPGK